jgi:hypothetical protein
MTSLQREPAEGGPVCRDLTVRSVETAVATRPLTDLMHTFSTDFQRLPV